ncbi:Uridine permease/thiamine transporter/allantoin transport [Phaffia rhodozyma]|uniref:Uridine permease/thiamine transporter/allantoin transport n=1 Tax=Phaffia rhodozyma TaxID=264483 RepID=A0A0F7SRJ8_PHARH|nr:Uridine permease/thiamine transporter/allantoin transport [Phaffia rhodozyma]
MKFDINRLRVKEEEFTYGSIKVSNRDLAPTLPKDRTWTTGSYIAFWFADALNIPTWEMASSIMSLGLDFKTTLPCIFLGHVIISIPITLQGSTGATLRTPFPIQARSSFGHHLSKFAVLSRLILACVWFGVQSYSGSQSVNAMIVALSPSFRDYKNSLPDSANITSGGLLCYFIFWVLQFPFILIHPSKIKYFFLAKSIMVPIAFVGLFIWSLSQAGVGPVFTQKATLSGSAKGWAFMSSMNSVLGNYTALSVNIPDFTRYATNKKAQYVQLVIIPVVFTMAAFIGMTVSSGASVIYNQDIIWNPLTILDLFDDDAKGRAARFFCGFAFAFASMGTNISANSISGAADLTSLFPTYFNIRRGSIAISFIGGWAITPWNIMESGAKFLAFMGGYTVFLAPMVGMLIADYYLVRQGKVDVPSLYAGKHGRYYYTKGFNWRALVTMAITYAPTIPGLINTISPEIAIGTGLTHLYDLTWLFGTLASVVIYTSLSKLFPDPESHIPKAIYADDDPVLSPSTMSYINREGEIKIVSPDRRGSEGTEEFSSVDEKKSKEVESTVNIQAA